MQFSTLRYSDDITLMASSIEYMVEILQCLEEISTQSELLIIRSKMKIIVINISENNSPQIQELNGIEVVNHFIYLDSVEENTGGCEAEIGHRAHIKCSAIICLVEIWVGSPVSKVLKI